MSKKFRFIWIDDDPRRKLSSDNLKASLGFVGDFVPIRGDYQEKLDLILLDDEPDLIIMDHNLEKTTTGVFKKGSTFAAYIRETWPECPIICVTGEDLQLVDSQQRYLYQDVFSISQISRHYLTVRSIAEHFRHLKKNRPTNIDQLLDLMKAPKEDRKRIKAIVPQEIMDNFDDSSLLLIISHWLRNIFLKRPGFLYDRLWTSTLLGLKEASFEKVDNLFVKARYNGIFSDKSNGLWWKSKLISILADKVQQLGLPWEKGRSLPGITKKDFSISYVNGGDYPETVAFIDDSRNAERAPMKISETLPHPNYENLLFFEEVRIMKPA